MVYIYSWCNKYLTYDARTIGDMIRSLQAAVDLLRRMEAAGVMLDPDGGMEGGVKNDDAELITDDPEVAAQFDFEPDEEFDEEFDEDDDEELAAECDDDGIDGFGVAPMND